jgi:hypothetical protein
MHATRFPFRAIAPARRVGEAAGPGPYLTAPDSVEAAFLEFLEKGDHAEVLEFEALLGPGTVGGAATLHATLGHPLNVWDFIDHAVDGSGGFSTGEYLYPFPLELDPEFPKRLVALADGTTKWDRRRRIVDYDAFPGDICNAPIDLIASKADMVKREIEDARAAEWVANVDGLGTTLGEFMEPVFREARKFGVAYVFLDRPGAVANLREDLAPENRPYPYLVRTRNVRRWTLSPAEELVALVIAEPSEPNEVTPPVRVWTPEGWALYRPLENGDHGKRSGWALERVASLQVPGAGGRPRIPVIRVANDRPSRGKSGLGQTEMLKVARLGQAHFNMESEAREIERKAAAPIFAIPVKDAKGYADDGGALVTGMDSAVAYDGEGDKPGWIQPDLAVLDTFEQRKAGKVATAYRLAKLDALASSPSSSGSPTSSVQGSSGYHLEMAFSKTETRIARYAGNMEAAETALVVLCLAWYGEPREAAAELVEIAYPREFGVRDLDRLLDRTTKELDLVQGEDAQRAILEGYFKVRFPRKTPAEITGLVESEMKKRASLKKQIQAAAAKVQQSIGTAETKQIATGVAKG